MTQSDNLFSIPQLPLLDSTPLVKDSSDKKKKKKAVKQKGLTADTNMRNAFIRVSAVNHITEDNPKLGLKAGDIYTISLDDIKETLEKWAHTKKTMKYYFIMHDADPNNVHYHIVLDFDKNSVGKFSLIKKHFPYGKIEPAKSVKASVQYLIHMNHPYKKQYSEKNIYTNNKDKLYSYLVMTAYGVNVRGKFVLDQIISGKLKEHDMDYFKRLHECILTECSNQLRQAQLENLFGIETVELSEEVLDDFGDREYILERISKELNVQFNTHRQILLKTLYAYVAQNRRMFEDNDGICMYGTTAYHAVWEKICAEVFDNKLNTSLGQLKMHVPLAEEFQNQKKDSLIDIIEKPIWEGADTTQTAKDTLIPDLISMPSVGDVDYFVIFDAKYYLLQLEKGKNLRGNPGVGDVTKQYLYQLAYKKFIEAHHIAVVKNCFLMPTEKDEIIKKGTARMPMLEALGLENIQIRQLPAAMMYEYYLTQRKMDIRLLDL